jgi:hypothetical protein
MHHSSTHHATLTFVTTITVTLLIGATGCVSLDRIEEFESTELGVDVAAHHLSVENDAGEVNIEAADVESISVHAEIYGEETRLERRLDDGVLYLESDIPWPCGECRIDLTIVVPSQVSVVVDNGSGYVTLDGLAADARIDQGSGRISVDGFTGEVLELRSGSGSISAQNVDAETVTVGSGSGYLDLGFDTAPLSLDTESGSGRQTIEVPAGTYNVDWTVGSGHFSTDGITLSDTAPNAISASSGSGSIAIRGFSL